MPRSGQVHACAGTLGAVLAGTGGICESPLYGDAWTEPGMERHSGFNRLISNRNSQ